MTGEGTRAGLALGTAQLGLAYGVANRTGAPDGAEAERILRLAVERGVRWLDTAPGYGDAEARIGALLPPGTRPDDLRICSKLPALPPGLESRALRQHITEALDGSRRRLRTERLHAWLLHGPDDLDRYGRVLLDALQEHRDAGRVGRIGVSVYGPAGAAALLEVPELQAVQLPYNLLDRRCAEGGLMSRLAAGGVLRFARSALLQGLLVLDPASRSPTDPATDWLLRVRALLTRHGLDPVAGAVAFAAMSGADFVVLGAERADQLSGALDALHTPLPSAFLAEVTAGLADPPLDVIDPRRWEAA